MGLIREQAVCRENSSVMSSDKDHGKEFLGTWTWLPFHPWSGVELWKGGGMTQKAWGHSELLSALLCWSSWTLHFRFQYWSCFSSSFSANLPCDKHTCMCIMHECLYVYANVSGPLCVLRLLAITLQMKGVLSEVLLNNCERGQQSSASCSFGLLPFISCCFSDKSSQFW